MRKRSIRETLPRLIKIIIVLLLILITPVHIWLQFYTKHQSQRESSREVFGQLEQVIAINEQDIRNAKNEYTESCIQSAEMAAYFVQNNPSVPNSLEECQILADKLEVDELHFFTPEGEIYSGTHPQYYGYTFESGEQMSFFAPMLQDKTLKLCQDIMPNTAEGKNMQYAAVWTEDGSQIVQIGMEPKRLQKLIQEKSLENVVSTFPFDFSGYLHVLDVHTNKIIASTSPNLLGKDFGVERNNYQEQKGKSGLQMYHYNYEGKRYCSYTKQYGDYLLVRTYLSSFLLKEVIASTVMMVLYICVVGTVLIGMIGWYIRKNVSNNLTNIVDELKKIESGDLKNITIQTGMDEFDKLIFYINQLLKTIRLSWAKVSDVIDRSGLPLGVFEYNHFYKKALMNDRLLEILDIQEDISVKTKIQIIREKIQNIEKHRITEDKPVYEYRKREDIVYLRIEKRTDEQSETYYITDVSQWWDEVNHLKHESIRDSLTSLYNRRGFNACMEELFRQPEKLGYSVLVMLDADGLKRINDVYGHFVGDEYLKQISKLSELYAEEHSVFARLGGDEFVIFLFGYRSRKAVLNELLQLEKKRGRRMISEDSEIDATIEFSAGYAFYPEDGQDYHRLMRVADKNMYLEKKSRKRILQTQKKGEE